MKYLFVIYSDIEYKEHLDNFKTQEFYRQICDDPNIEVMEWGSDFHTDYNDLPIKTQQMMKWCSENKEYDYLIKCDDTIFDDKWIHYSDRLDYEKLFLNDLFEHQWKWGEENFNIPIGKDARDYGFIVYDNGVWGKWESTNKLSDDYRGINLLKLSEQDWKNYAKDHNFDNFDVSKLKDIPFFEGKFYMVSKEFSIFISEQEKFDMPGIEDYMIGYLIEDFK
jgi:hypothetical protein|tara:strand:+ start:43 stop:708 length:666 start_codon:yes stop_codon:yes gene_type:complete